MQISCAIFCDCPVPSLSIATDSSFFSCVCFGGEVQKWAEAELEITCAKQGVVYKYSVHSTQYLHNGG
jgi:hypothetical protein